MNNSVNLWIPGRAVGKARPRLNSRTGKVYTSDRYGTWKRDAIFYLKDKYGHLSLPSPCKVDCSFVNFYSSDSDNLLGSILDVLVQAEYLGNDSSSFVVSSSGTFVTVRKPKNAEKPMGVLVSVVPMEMPKLDYLHIADKLAMVAC